MIGAALCLAILGTLCIPLADSVALLAFPVASQGLACGLIGVGINVLIFPLHEGGRVDPYMQALHFLFGVGALVAPPIIAWTIAASGDVKAAFVTFGLLGIPVVPVLFHASTPYISDPLTNNDKESTSDAHDLDLHASSFLNRCTC